MMMIYFNNMLLQKQELYWCDVTGIHRVKYNGENLEWVLVALLSQSHPYGVVVYENTLYWIDT